MTAANSAAFCLLPSRRWPAGPVTARRLARTLIVYLAVFLAGLGLAQTMDFRLQALGLGLMAPGAGFVLHVGVVDLHGWVHIVLALLSAALFGMALLLWFATGNALAPPAVWLASAAGAALMPHAPVYSGAIVAVPAAITTLMLGGAICVAAWIFLCRGRRREANAYLSAQPRFCVDASGAAPPLELSPRELHLMRFLLDRSLQPVADFDGFEWRDQFQTAAVRYQLNFAGYALAMAQATRMPALDAWLGEAQRRLIEKQADPRVWGYWKTENRWGNLDGNADPVARDNIMYGGFCAAQMAMFHAASGQRDYEQASSFTLRGNAAVYEHSLPTLIAALDRGYEQSPFTLMACEPNWIYPLCNTIGAAAMRAHDHMTGSAHWLKHEAQFRRRFEEEFVDGEGRILPCRSNYTGFALPCVGGAAPQALPCLFLNAIMPDIATRQWLLLRRRLYRNEKREDELDRSFFWRIDTGNYGFSRAAAYACTALAANEMGDSRVANLCLQALDAECPATQADGGWYRPRASVWAHAVEFFARVGARDAFQGLVHAPRAEGGITLAKAAYPAVLCASATRAHETLTAVFYPGLEHGPHEIGLAGLAPGATYACEGACAPRLLADTQGRATVRMMIGGRSVLHVARKR